jgi:hypothetical protein
MIATQNNIRTQCTLRLVPAALVLVLLLATGGSDAAGRNSNPGVLPPNSIPHGHSYGEWSAALWQQAIDAPVAGNPFVTGQCYELRGSVWALAAPIATNTYSCTVPLGKTLFVPGLTVECSSLEPPDSGFHGDTEVEQAQCAKFWADHIVDVSIAIDGAPVQDLASYRVVSPQFAFTAPDPNILGVPGGGAGTAVADGYYVMLAPLSKGAHTIHIRGALHLSVADGDPFDLDAATDAIFHITVD